MIRPIGRNKPPIDVSAKEEYTNEVSFIQLDH